LDALALLCTLHAEGPRTLRLLREAGCRDVREFLTLDSEVVSALLDVPPAVARRLAREGQHLAGRVGASFLEPEDGEGRVPDPNGFAGAPAQAIITPAPAVAHAPSQPLETAPVAPTEVAKPLAAVASAPVGEPTSVGAHLSSAERQILDKVLQRWREGDGADPVAAADVLASAELVREPEPESSPAEPVCAPPLEIAGLPHASVLALEAAGFTTARAVADANTMALASAVGCAFGDARRYQFLAARAAAASPAVPVSNADNEIDVPERLIERPPIPAAVVAQRPTAEAIRPPAPAPEPAPEPRQVAFTPPAVEAVPLQQAKTVLNWDFVQPEAADPKPEPDEDGPQAGGPFA
jgi:hypothetical protein